MIDANDDNPACGRCGVRNLCFHKPQGAPPAQPDEAAVNRFVRWSAIVFLAPLATGIAGAWAAGRLWAAPSAASLGRWHAVGLGVGLIAGVLLARLLLSVRRPASSSAGGDQ